MPVASQSGSDVQVTYVTPLGRPEEEREMTLLRFRNEAIREEKKVQIGGKPIRFEPPSQFLRSINWT